MTGRGQPRKRKPQRFHHTFPFAAMSVNKAWIAKGRRYPSGYYNKFEKAVFSELVNSGYTRGCLNLGGNLKLRMEAGVSSKLSDLDNLLKCAIDCLVKFFGTWDDRMIQEINIRKKMVSKGDEYFTILITKTRRKI